MFLILPKSQRPFGVLVSTIIDVETRPIELDPALGPSDGLFGTAIVGDRLTLFLDIHRLIRHVEPAAATRQVAALPGAPRVLLVEDTQFFREVVKSCLEAEGYEVTTANDGAQGLARLDDQAFDLIVSDLEMPVLDGWSFARAVRQRPEGARQLLLALTSLSAAADRDRARESGFDAYEVKLDRERLVSTVAELLKRKGKPTA
jgi:two-component system chemotaxis sensor kinase CheA